ncbi:MAG: LCP family protein [Actinomycetota bacterium]|nr:LCP family protein [Actinomycetota bacterium]
MRTTLKRGIGRAPANGNGNGYLPPGVLTPVARYSQPPPPRRSFAYTVGRAFLWALALVGVLSAGASGGLYMWLHTEVAVTAPKKAIRKAAKTLQVAQPGKPAIALLIGSDHRYQDGAADAGRSDTIMLLRTDPGTKSISMLSFPRDLNVDIRCPGRATWTGKINAAYAECGPSGTLETVRHLTGLPVNYLINVNFIGFVKVVDSLGGAWIDVDHRYFNNHTGPSGYAKIDLQPGYQRLSGSDALDYVRYRHTDSDLYRNARQQEFVKAVKAQVGQISPYQLAFRIPKIVNAIVHNTEIGEAGGKGVDFGTLKNYAFFLYRLPSGHFFQPRLQGLTGFADLSTDQSNIDAAVRDFMNPDVTAPERANRAALGVKPMRTRTIPPSAISITILNGNGVARSAADTSFLLAQRGYRTQNPPAGQNANAPNFNYFRTQIYFDPLQRRSRAAAIQVGKLFGDAQISVMPPIIAPKANGAMLVGVLGQTHHGQLGPAPPAPEPIKHEPPHVSRNPGLTAAQLRALRRQVPFRLEVPTLIESSSTLGPEAAIRPYRIAGTFKAVRLVFSIPNAAGEYWGIEQTNWADAPVLGGRNFGHVLGGRTFDFYYSGQRLHMVVLRENGATYWVVNTLTDKLSNETMIAIARGLRTI